MRSCDAEHEAGRRNDPVVRAQYRRAQPANPCCTVVFPVTYRHFLYAWTNSLEPERYCLIQKISTGGHSAEEPAAKDALR